MPSDNCLKLQKIKRVSVVFRMLCKVLLALIAFIGISSVVCLAFGVGGVNYDNIIFDTAGLPLGHRLAMAVFCALALTALFNCFYQLHRLFGNYARGEIFTRGAVSQLRQLGVACLLWGGASLLWASSLALSSAPPRSFTGHFDSLVTGAILIVIAWFMDMAVDLREENELTI